MAGCVAGVGERVQKAALPLHVQKLQKALRIDCLVSQVERLFGESLINKDELSDPLKKGMSISEQIAPRVDLHNFTNATEERKWIQDLLLSNSEGSDSELSESEQLQIMMELQYKRKKKWRKRLKRDPKLWKYRYFSAGLLLSHDPYPDHLKKLEEQISSGDAERKVLREVLADEVKRRKEEERHKVNVQKEKERYQEKLWAFISKKEIPKMAKQFSNARHNIITNNKRIAQLCQREVRKVALKSQRASKEANVQPRVRRLMREALIYWRRYERVEREQRKKAEKEALGQRKIDDEMREARRQQRKLNFLITQTELYAHFMAKKLTGETDQSDQILRQLEDGPLQREIRPGVVVNLEQPDEYDSETVKAQALANVQSAFIKHEEKHKEYAGLARGSTPGGGGSTDLQESFDKQFSLATPMLLSDREVPQPAMFKGTLKVYQLKGMNWLANLYDQGINGILADEMGLGKTVQSIAFLAHLAERQGTWGPFLIVSPASTLHNWQQECTRFVPHFKALPYWGSPHERKVIRKYWNQKLLYKENAPFHILITSYQLVVQDVRYFQRVKWQYMILDEAQAIKSSSSVRWKVLLSFNCRNRLLLTGTPIQNTMQELWALLHFIMPTMFDSHEEFNEWFSKDIESHAEKKSALDQEQLSRLHMILKPFMLRRIKRDVEHEMAEKIEVHLSCNLSTRQRRLYHGLRQRISIEDLLQSSTSQTTSKDSSASHLLNLVMQFRKVCNHPDLFERRDVKSPSTSLPIPSFYIPRLLYHEALKLPVDEQRLLTVTLGVHTSHHIHRTTVTESSDGCWSFLRLINTSPAEASTMMLGSMAERLQIVLHLLERVSLLYQQRYWDSSVSRCSHTQLLLWPTFPTSHLSTLHSLALRGLVFTGHASTTYTHTTHRVFPLKTTAATSAELTKISSTISDHTSDSQLQPATANGTNQLPSSSVAEPEQAILNGFSPYLSTPLPVHGDASLHKGSLKPQEMGSALNEGASIPNGFVDSSTAMETEAGELPTHKNLDQDVPLSLLLTTVQPSCTEYHCMPTDMPKFLTTFIPKVQVPWNPLYCSDRSAEFARLEWLTGGPSCLKQLLFHGRRERRRQGTSRAELFPPTPAGVDALRPPNGWSHIYIPDKENMIHDSGKMAVLDKLLVTLKREGHRVLIYSQMTRMIDLLEEFMAYRRYKYIRLDGSSRISDRRDMVDDFQTKSDIFVFLLSTRAGGLGINLTAADTVIFYDSDWNPTVDQQAMDRAHRLGQTKQVTVYRLVVKGTIEERILQRAREKSEIQKMVISGGDFKPDALKPKEMVSLLLDDEEMETRFLAKQAERKAQQEQQVKKKSKKRKNNPNGRENEPLLKRPNTGGLISGTPSPLMFSRPDSVVSLNSTGDVMNGEDTPDIIGSTDGSEVNSESSRQGSTPVRQRGGTIAKTSVPLGGRGKMHRKKAGGGSGSAAASAGAMAGALAATNAAYATYGYNIPASTYHVSSSPSNSIAASPASTFHSVHAGSTHSSPRASPVPTGLVMSQTPPSSKNSKSSLSYTKNTSLQ